MIKPVDVAGQSDRKQGHCMSTSIGGAYARSHSLSYEWKSVLLLTFGFGVVGLDRWIITPLFPQVMQDLNLNYQDLGNLIGVLGITWSAAAIVMGRMSDRFGRRKVLIPAVILFSLLSGLSGLVFGLIAMFAGPIAAEAAPVALMSSAMGVIGGVAPAFGLLCCCALCETAPRKLQVA